MPGTEQRPPEFRLPLTFQAPAGQNGRVAFAALEPHFAQRLMQAAGQSDSDVRSMSRPEAHAAVAAFAKDKTRAQLDALSVAKDIPLFTLKA